MLGLWWYLSGEGAGGRRGGWFGWDWQVSGGLGGGHSRHRWRSFYLSAVDDLLRHPDDNPTIGLLLCKGKGKLTVEYALRSSSSPIGVASYETKLLESLPKNLKSSLPSVAQIEAELEKQEALINIEKKKRVKMATKKKRSL